MTTQINVEQIKTSNAIDSSKFLKWDWTWAEAWWEIKKVSDVSRTWPSNTLIVTDTDCTADSVILWWTIKSWAQAWFWQFTVGSWQFTIDSTDDESSLTFNYIIYK